MHGYEHDPQSGAGNCVCGRSERHRQHWHMFLSGWKTAQQLCTCGLPPEAECHLATVAMGLT